MRNILWMALLGWFTLEAQAQTEEIPVQWSYEAEALAEDEALLVFTADIIEGWYLYSQHIEEGGPIPTDIVFYESEGVEFLGKAEESGDKVEGMDSIFGMYVAKFRGKAQFRQRVKWHPGQHTLRGYVEFMTCDDEMCLPPTQLEFTFVLK